MCEKPWSFFYDKISHVEKEFCLVHHQSKFQACLHQFQTLSVKCLQFLAAALFNINWTANIKKKTSFRSWFVPSWDGCKITLKKLRIVWFFTFGFFLLSIYLPFILNLAFNQCFAVLLPSGYCSFGFLSIINFKKTFCSSWKFSTKVLL